MPEPSAFLDEDGDLISFRSGPKGYYYRVIITHRRSRWDKFWSLNGRTLDSWEFVGGDTVWYKWPSMRRATTTWGFTLGALQRVYEIKDGEEE